MPRSDPFSYFELFRRSPIESTLLVAGPLVLAVAQLGNSYINNVSIALSLAFAITMVGFASVAIGHQAARYRLRRLESGPMGSE